MFERINKTDKPLTKLIKRKEKPVLVQLEMKKVKSQQTPWKQKSVENYFKNLSCNRLEKLEEIQKFLDMYESLKLNQDDRKTLNRVKLGYEIEVVIKTLPTSPVWWCILRISALRSLRQEECHKV